MVGGDVERLYGFSRSCLQKVIYRYLDCGILHNGFAGVKCKDCGHECLLLLYHICDQLKGKFFSYSSRVILLSRKDGF
jgi:hypothetical protein